MSEGLRESTGAGAVAAMHRWREKLEPITGAGITALPWEAVLTLPLRVFELGDSVMVTRDFDTALGRARSVFAAAGSLDNSRALLSAVEGSTVRDGLKAVVSLGRRGWGRAIGGYREEATLYVKEL